MTRARLLALIHGLLLTQSILEENFPDLSGPAVYQYMHLARNRTLVQGFSISRETLGVAEANLDDCMPSIHSALMGLEAVGEFLHC